MTCLAYSRENVEESYVDHVKRSLSVWSILRKYYEKSIERVVGLSIAKIGLDPIALGLMMHDAGKLFTEYQRGSRREYRHEIVSAVLTYDVITKLGISNDAVVHGVPLAVMLHHEPIIMGVMVGGFGERYLTMTSIKHMIMNSDLSLSSECKDIENMYSEIINHARKLNLMIKEDTIGAIKDSVDSVSDLSKSREHVLEVLRKLIARVSVGSTKELLAFRAKVSALLHPLVISDSIAACGGREGDTTNLVKRAINGAEPLNSNDFNDEVIKNCKSKITVRP